MKLKFIQKIIDRLRGKKQNNGISDEVLKNNSIKIDKKNYKNVCLNITGKNNTIILEENELPENAVIHIILFGDNNTVEIKKNIQISSNITMEIGRKHPAFGKVENCRVLIGENTSVESCLITVLNSGVYTEIGSDCMLANNINLYNTDSHPILDIKTNKIINRVKGIKIGNHCWIGRNATILKNTEIADNCIVGWGAVVSGKHTEPDCAVAGNPAKTVKKGIIWQRWHKDYISQTGEKE